MGNAASKSTEARLHMELLNSAQEGDLEKTQLTLNELIAKTESDSVDESCDEAAKTAAAMDHWQLAQLLVESISNSQMKDNSAKQLALLAAKWGRFDLFDLFLGLLNQEDERQLCHKEAIKLALVRHKFNAASFLLSRLPDGEEKYRSCLQFIESMGATVHWESATPFLLNVIGDESARNRCCTTAARRAIEEGNNDQLHFYMEQVTDTQARDQLYRQMINSAVRNDRIDTGNFLIRLISSQAERDRCRMGAAETAAGAGSLRVARLFMDSIEDSQVRIDCEQRVVAQAALRGRVNVVRAIGIRPQGLLSDASVLNFVATRAMTSDNSILNETLKDMQSVEIAQLLLKSISSGHVALAITLMPRIDGEDIDWPDRTGSTALMLSADAGHHELIKKLLSFGASVFVEDNQSRTALSRACEAGHVRAAKCLLDAGADPNHVDGRGLTCAGLAEQFKHYEVLELLRPIASEPSKAFDVEVQRDKEWDREKSLLLHEYLCQAGFTTHRVKCQQDLADLVQGLAQELGKPEDWQMTGSYAEGWANSLVQVNGRTAADSDIDWTVMVTGRMFHLEGGCANRDEGECRNADKLTVLQGHAQVRVATGSQPAVRSPASGVRPAQDTCHAFQCCSGFTDGAVRLLKCVENRRVHLVSATRSQSDKELRLSSSFQEKDILRELTTVQGQLFIIIKFIFKRLLPKELSTPGLKTYHAKTLLFFMLEKYGVSNSAAWKPENLIELLKDSLSLMIRYIDSSSSPDECMPHYFLPDAPLYFKNAGIGGHFNSTKTKIRDRLSELRNNTEIVIRSITEHMQPLETEMFHCHPFTLLPLKQPPLVTTGLREADHRSRQHLVDGFSVIHRCLRELQSHADDRETLTRQLSYLSGLQWCKCATLCLTVMKHLKMGDTEEATTAAGDLQHCIPSTGWFMDQHKEWSPVIGLKTWRCPLDIDWAWRFCFPTDDQPDFDYLPKFTQTLLTARLSQSRCSHLYVNFRCLSWSLQAELLRNRTSKLELNVWRENLDKDPDLDELLTLAHYSQRQSDLQFCLEQIDTIMSEERMTFEAQDEERILRVKNKLKTFTEPFD